MKLAAYLRVSTDRQVDEGLGLDIQERGIRSWAKTNGHRVVVWHRDEGISGSNGIDSRRGLLDALTALEDRRADGLVMYRLDRLARNLTVQEATLSKCWGLGAKVFSVDLGEVPEDDPDDPIRTALRQMVGVFAQLERGMISARMRGGRRLKGERGGYAYGAPKYGQRSEGKELVPNESEALVIARMVELRAMGQSYRAICASLKDEGIQPRRALADDAPPRADEDGPKEWQPTVVRRILVRAAAQPTMRPPRQ